MNTTRALRLVALPALSLALFALPTDAADIDRERLLRERSEGTVAKAPVSTRADSLERRAVSPSLAGPRTGVRQRPFVKAPNSTTPDRLAGQIDMADLGRKMTARVRRFQAKNLTQSEGPRTVSFTLRSMIKAAEAGEPLPVSLLGNYADRVLRGDDLLLDILVHPGAEGPAASAVAALEGEVVKQWGSRLIAWVPYALLPAIETQTSFMAVRLRTGRPMRVRLDGTQNQGAQNKIGTVTSEGVAMLGAEEWHEFDPASIGVERDEPVRVAILETGFDGYADMLGEDLPPQVTTQDFAPAWDIEGCLDGVPNDPCSAAGTALAEVVTDMDPSARLTLIAIDPADRASFQATLDYLVPAGGTPLVDVVVQGPVAMPGRFGDGFGAHHVSDLVKRAIDAGVMWIAETGDLDYLRYEFYQDPTYLPDPTLVSDGHWTGEYADAVDHYFHGTFDADGYMDAWFPTQDTSGPSWLNPFCLGPGDELHLELVWTSWVDQNLDGTPEAIDDYAIDVIEVRDETQFVQLATSSGLPGNYQGGDPGDMPWDSLLFENLGDATVCANLAIHADYADWEDTFHLYWAGYNGDHPGTMSAGFQPPFTSPGGTRMIPADQAGVLAVGSVKLDGTAEPFTATGMVGESTPAFCAPANVATAAFYSENFLSSFSAGHAAGAVSLLMSKLGFITPAEALDVLRARSVSVAGDTDGVVCGQGRLCMLTNGCP